LQSAGAGSVMKATDNVWHIIAGQRAPAIAAAIKLDLSDALHKPAQVA
jgi:hypothetical protein